MILTLTAIMRKKAKTNKRRLLIIKRTKGRNLTMRKVRVTVKKDKEGEGIRRNKNWT
jgi:hypothetical protein